MKSIIKRILREILLFCQIPLTRNMRYDILTKKILKRTLQSDSSCVDVGAHKGEVLRTILQFAPQGKHFAFEPIPSLYERLNHKMGTQVRVFPFALSNQEGRTTFHLVKDDPAYSGLRRRLYKSENTQVEEIEVEVKRMDDLLAARTQAIHLMKIDVEGGELDVLRGAKSILETDGPLLIFECGKGATEFYNNTPEMVFDFLKEKGYRIYSLTHFLKEQKPFDSSQFLAAFHSGSDYYFIASKA
jgi:FkbM family methyltransferase